MTWFTGTVVFVLVWWTVLFAVLPLWTRPDPDGDPAAGGWRGAPERPLIVRKLLVTTAVAIVVWAVAAWLITSDWISFRPPA